MAERFNGYTLVGKRTDLTRDGGVFVQRCDLPGKPWLMFVRKLDGSGWCPPTAYKTRRKAIEAF